MSERKNIDRLFQEKFKDFEVQPSEEIWGNIESKLDEKKKKRILPFWWKLSGVAAIFLLVFLISRSIYNPEIKTNNPVVNENNSNKIEQTNKEESKNNRLSSDAVITNSGEIRSNTVLEENKNTIQSSKFSIAERKSSNHRSLKNSTSLKKNKSRIAKSIFGKEQEQVAQKATNKSTSINEIVQTEIDKKANVTIDSKTINLDNLKGNSISKIATKEIEKKVNDTTKKNSVANNVLEELLNEKESKSKQESKRNRWQLTSNVAPIFLGSISNGSPIDSTLSKNSKSYNTNVGFGLGVSYFINKKLSVRTGLNKVSISYNTNDILFFTGIQAKMLANVSPTASSTMIHVQTLNNNTSNTPSETSLLPFENSFVHENSGYLKQEIGYLEMPVEMTYAFFDKKFGLKIIGGFSTLFLEENSIKIISESRDTLLGKANNLNNIHFSTNFGLGIKYGFMKSFEFNLEPTVKYQLNTFSANAGNFKPYIFGIYSGISYRF